MVCILDELRDRFVVFLIAWFELVEDYLALPWKARNKLSDKPSRRSGTCPCLASVSRRGRSWKVFQAGRIDSDAFQDPDPNYPKNHYYIHLLAGVLTTPYLSLTQHYFLRLMSVYDTLLGIVTLEINYTSLV